MPAERLKLILMAAFNSAHIGPTLGQSLLIRATQALMMRWPLDGVGIAINDEQYVLTVGRN